MSDLRPLPRTFAGEDGARRTQSEYEAAGIACEVVQDRRAWTVRAKAGSEMIQATEALPVAPSAEVAVVPAEVQPDEIVNPYFLVARSPAEMQTAKDRLVTWFRAKAAEEAAAEKELSEALENARIRKWKITGLQAALVRQKKRAMFYGKCLDASLAGYTIIPEVGIDVFAIRAATKKPYPTTTHDTGYPYRAPDPGVTIQRTPTGEGRYVATTAMASHSSREDADKLKHYYATAVGFKEPEFPMALANPVLMQAAHEAMGLKLFDEMGISAPPLNAPASKRDPMLIGRIGYRHGYTEHQLCWLIAWWIDLRTL